MTNWKITIFSIGDTSSKGCFFHSHVFFGGVNFYEWSSKKIKGTAKSSSSWTFGKNLDCFGKSNWWNWLFRLHTSLQVVKVAPSSCPLEFTLLGTSKYLEVQGTTTGVIKQSKHTKPTHKTLMSHSPRSIISASHVEIGVPRKTYCEISRQL